MTKIYLKRKAQGWPWNGLLRLLDTSSWHFLSSPKSLIRGDNSSAFCWTLNKDHCCYLKSIPYLHQRLLLVLFLLSFTTMLSAQSWTNKAQGTNFDYWVINQDKSNHWSSLRLQVSNNQAWNMYHANGNSLYWSYDDTGHFLHRGSNKMQLSKFGNLELLSSLRVKNGGLGAQLQFSHNGTRNFTHVIKSRHHGSNAAGNALDFYLWNQGTDHISSPGSKHVMTLSGNGSGRVGIGTGNPTEKLEVNGGIKATAFRIGHQLDFIGLAKGEVEDWPMSFGGPVLFGKFGGSLGTRIFGNQYSLSWDHNGDVRIRRSLTTSNGGTSSSGMDQLIFSHHSGYDLYRHSIKTRHNANSPDGNALDFYVWNNTIDEAVAVGTRHIMTLDGGNDGSVGIGTTSPGEKLEVIGNVKAAAFIGDGSQLTNLPSSDSFWTNIDNDNDITFLEGNVGIGTDSPSEKLEVHGNVKIADRNQAEIELDGGNSDGFSWSSRLLLNRKNRSKAAGIWINETQESDHDWYMGVPYDGGNPINGFSVGYDASQPELLSSALFLLNNDGKVGIGTTSPAAKLEVEGNGIIGHWLLTSGNVRGVPAVLFRHKELNSGNFYALGQTNVGHTIVNAAAGQDLHFNIEGYMKMEVDGSTGNIGIGGVDSPSRPLTVQGTALIYDDATQPAISGAAENYNLYVTKGILSEDLAIATTGQWGADYVFEKDYRLTPLSEIEAFVTTHKHLPDVKSVTEVKANDGIYEVDDMLVGQLKNLEEQVLHNIAQEKKIQAQEKELKEQQATLESQQALIQSLIQRIEKLEAATRQ